MKTVAVWRSRREGGVRKDPRAPGTEPILLVVGCLLEEVTL
jgi:hypothetical protein